MGVPKAGCQRGEITGQVGKVDSSLEDAFLRYGFEDGNAVENVQVRGRRDEWLRGFPKPFVCGQ